MKFSELMEWLNNRFVDISNDTDLAKYECLYQAILSAIRERVLSPGDRLPPEQDLSKHLPLSQATVRRCFTLLAQRGVISREHGRGTFISAEEEGVSDLWHFRFRDPEHPGFMAIYNRILSRSVKTDPLVANEFPGGADEFIYIERAVNIGSRFNCYSELFLPVDKFARIMDESIAELERVNLKDILTKEFRSPTLSVDQNMSVAPVPERASETIGVAAGSLALSLCVTGYTFEDQPISFQRIWIPETPHKLNIPASNEAIDRRGSLVPVKAISNG